MLKVILERLFGGGDPSTARPDFPAGRGEPEPKVLGASTCVLIEMGKDTAAVIAAAKAAGMSVREIARGDVAAIADQPPDLVISACHDPSEILATISSLNEISYRGRIQPIGDVQIEPIGDQRHGTTKVLPSLPSPASVSALRTVIETEGLARTPAGHAAVRLATALEKKWLTFAFQPKISLRSMMLAGAETFARVQHPVHGTLLPNSFLPHSTARDLRLLGRASVEAAISSWEPFHRLGFNLLLSVNIPLEALDAADLIDVVRRKRPSDRSWPGIVVEIETADMLSATDEVRDFAHTVRRAGMFVSLDNFGTSASMTTDLTEIGMTEVKLHPRLVQEANINPARGIACRAAIDLARAYRANVGASAVESIEDVTFLRKLGCETAQGRVFAPPLDRAGFASLLRTKATREAS